MKNRILTMVIVSFLLSYSTYSQETNSGKTKSNDKSNKSIYIFSDDLLIDKETYWLACKDTLMNGQKKFKFHLYKDKSYKEFELTRIEPTDKTINIFWIEFKKAFDLLKQQNNIGKNADDKELENQIKINTTEYLFKLYANIINDTTDITLVVGELKAKDSINYYYLKPRNFADSVKKGVLYVKLVEIKFEEEQIVDIKVTGTTDSVEGKLLFQNRIPISYSTKADVSFDKRVNFKLKHREIILYDPQDSFKIRMRDVFSNDYKLLKYSENYSPKDQIVILNPSEEGKVIGKDKVTTLFSAKVYSDLLGLNDSQPNGLIQTELNKRIYLNRRSHKCGNKGVYWGLTNCINPHITISKIEENNKYLVPKYNNEILNINLIDLFEYTSWQTGGEFNLWYCGWPRMHSIFYSNVGFYIMHVPFKLPKLEEGQNFKDFRDIKINEDDNTFNANMIAFFPELNWIISPHSNLKIEYQVKWNYIWNPSKDIIIEDGKWVFGARFNASIQLNKQSESQIFFRSLYNFSIENPANNYLQTQIGYSFNVFKKSNNVTGNNLE